MYHPHRILISLILSSLFYYPIASFADCSPTGDIKGANVGQLTLGSGGCADAVGNTAATLFNGASITNNAGSALIAAVAAGHNPWQITAQSGSSVTASGVAIDLQDGGDTLTIQNNVNIVSSGSNAITSVGAGSNPVTIINS